MTQMQEVAAADGARPVRASVGFVHHREPRPEWTAALRDLSPMTDEHGVLAYVWEPGDPWYPAQRWTLQELVPSHAIDYELLQELRGPNPRATGHMCTDVTVPGQFKCLCRVKLDGWRQEDGSASGVTLTQWRVFRETGKFARPFWYVQGDKGGHKAFLTNEEKTYLTAAGYKAELPALGDLPYAEPDARVLEHVKQFNRLRALGLTLAAYRRRMGPEYKKERAEHERALREQLVGWLSASMVEEADLFISAARKGQFEGERTTTLNYDKLGGDEAMACYVETGQLPAPESYKSN